MMVFWPSTRAHALVRIAFHLRNIVGTRDMDLCEAQWLAYVSPLADASLSPSRMTAHGSGPMRFATPSSYRTCTDYSLPVSGALRKTLDNYRCYYLAIDVETSRGRRYRRRTQSRFNQSSNYEGDVACSGRSTNLKLIARSLAIITFSAKS